jgi:hypothetical protein
MGTPKPGWMYDKARDLLGLNDEQILKAKYASLLCRIKMAEEVDRAFDTEGDIYDY